MRYILLILIPVLAYADGSLIEQLGDSRYSVREAATRQICENKAQYYVEIVKSIQHSDPEIRWRCRYLATSLANEIPLQVFVDNPFLWRYRIDYMMQHCKDNHYKELRETLDVIVDHTPAYMYGPLVLKLYNASEMPSRAGYLEYIGKAACIYTYLKITPNPYFEVMSDRYRDNGFDELELIEAISKTKNEQTYLLFLNTLSSISQNKDADHALYLFGGNIWCAKKDMLVETLLCVLRSYPEIYSEQYANKLEQYRKIKSRPLSEIRSEMQEFAAMKEKTH